MNLRKYDEAIANESLGVFAEALIVATRDTKVNIFTTIIGFIVGIFAGHVIFSTSEPETGVLSVTDDGIVFLETEKKEITGQCFFSFDEIRKVIVGRNIIFVKQYTFVMQKSGFRVSIMPKANEHELLEILKKKLDTSHIALRKSKKGPVFATVLAAIFALVLAIVIFENNSGTTAPEFGYTYEITFPDVYFTEVGVGRPLTDAIMIYYDYVALTAHSVNRPFTRNFAVYQGDMQLDFWDGGLPARGYRDFLTTYTFSEGEVFHARRAVVASDSSQTIRIVKYDEGEIAFSQEFFVRAEE